MIKIILAAMMAVFLCLGSGTVQAQAVCGSRDALLKQLEGGYKETPASMALAANGTVVEVTRSDRGTWTILFTNPSGITCLMAAGEYWQDLKRKEKGKGT